MVYLCIYLGIGVFIGCYVTICKRICIQIKPGVGVFIILPLMRC